MTHTLPVGSKVEPLRIPPITRTTLALFAGASGDHNPIHIDIDVAKAAGMPDVFPHGMLTMAYVGRLLTDRFGQRALRSLEVRFVAIAELGDEMVCEATVAEILPGNGENHARLALSVTNQNGKPRLSGFALVAI